MRKITRETLLERAKRLLSEGCDRILAWKRGELSYDLTPTLFNSIEELESDFEYNGFSIANLSKYLVKETLKEGKIGVFLKPCDTYSFNQLLTEHRFDKEKVYAVALPCDGMLDAKKLASKCDSVLSVKEEGDFIEVETLFEGTLKFERKQLLAEKCLSCKSKKPVCGDEQLGFEETLEEASECNRFKEVEELEALPVEKRFAFWQKEFSRCIRCNACRDVCPACTCEKCIFDNPDSGFESKSPYEDNTLFHIIRAFHVAGRCTDCGECSRVCPQSIPLHLINRKFIKDINAFYGEYQAGAEVGGKSPLTTYDKAADLEPNEALGGKDNA